MATFSIKAQHDATHEELARVLERLNRVGCHFLTHARWGCSEGDHSAWLWLEADCEDEVRLVVPPALRQAVTVTRIDG